MAESNTPTTAGKSKKRQPLQPYKKTPLKKDLKIKVNPRSGLYQIFFSPGGQVPDMLKSEFTSQGLAQQEIDFYKEKIKKK